MRLNTKIMLVLCTYFLIVATIVMSANTVFIQQTLPKNQQNNNRNDTAGKKLKPNNMPANTDRQINQNNDTKPNKIVKQPMDTPKDTMK